MPTFMDSLASNPSGSIYGQPSQTSDQDVLNLVNQKKDREMRDFKEKSNFMSDLSLRQESRMRSLFPPESSQQGQPQNVVLGQDPNAMTGYQKGELGIRQQGINQDQQRL